MRLSRFGFSVVVIIYLVPLFFIAIVGNANAQGAMSDVYLGEMLLTAVLIGYAVFMMVNKEEVAPLKEAKARVDDIKDEVMNFSSISRIEYLYWVVLSAYALVNAIQLHSVNRNTQGWLAPVSALWMVVSVFVAAVAFYRFWILKSGQVVALSKRMVSSP